MFADQPHPKNPRILLNANCTREEGFARIPSQPENLDWRYVDCDAAPIEVHELGCDAEDCPRCGEQLIGCGCLPEAESLGMSPVLVDDR